jgi:hypothetical protein
MVHQGPFALSCAGSQGPKLQGELLGAPRLLPQMVEALTRRSILGRVVVDTALERGTTLGSWKPSRHTPGARRDGSHLVLAGKGRTREALVVLVEAMAVPRW